MGFGKKRSSKVGVGAITTNKKKLFAEGGMMDDGKDVDPVSGNDVPTGSLAEEVRDDVDAKLSPGEFVFPADVVRFIGLERLMQLRDQAKKGLSRMNDIGQMGNAEDVGEDANDTYENEDEFESEIDDIMKEVDREEMDDQTKAAFSTGGFVNDAYYDLSKAPKNPALDIRYFTDSEGKTFYMPFINGKPMRPLPNGALQTGTPTKTIPTTPTDKETTTGGITTGVGVGGASLFSGTGTSATAGASGTTAGAGTSVSVAGTYTGSNIADFGRSDLIYNPGGSGKAGELVDEDLWQGNISKWQVNLGSAALSTLAAAMGVPGILTMGLRAATNRYGVEAVNNFFINANQQDVARAGGIDINRKDTVIDPISGLPTSITTPTGRAAAASQIDQFRSRDDPTAAASAGALGTGGRAADVGRYVYEQLRDSGLSDAQKAEAAQNAVNAVIRGKSMEEAVREATAGIDLSGGTFGVLQRDMDTSGPEYGANDTFGVLASDMNFADVVNFSRDIGFDWGSMGDFGTAGGTGFKEFGNNDMIVSN